MAAHSSRASMTSKRARSLRSCSACTRTILPATSCDKAVGIIWTCLRSRWRTRSSRLGTARRMCAGAAMSSIPSARAGTPSRRSKRKSAACCSQQRPVPVEGNLIRRSWFLAYDKLPASPSRTKIVQSWDVAMMTGGQNDYSACTTWLTHKNDAYLLHVYRGRLEYPELRRKVIGLAAEHHATTVLIENAGPGMNLLQDLRAAMPRGMTRPIGVKPEGSKVDRMAAQSAKIEAGHVHLPNSAAWLGEFLTELLSFPNGRHDDQVDSVSQFLRWLQNNAYNQISFVAPILITRADMGLPPLHIDWSCRH